MQRNTQQQRNIAARAARRRKRIRQQMTVRVVCVGALLVMLSVLAFCVKHTAADVQQIQGIVVKAPKKYIADAPEFSVELLTPNEYSRPQTALEEVRGIVIHYTANPNTTAEQNRSYFEGLAQTKETYASSHFIVGISGEIIQCIPCSEISYASNDRNSDTVSIECCIPDESGKFTDETYQALIQLTAWLMGRYDISLNDVIRHYDVTGKNCPKYFVEHTSAWDTFKEDIADYIETYGAEKVQEDDQG